MNRDLTHTLKRQAELCNELLAVVEREGRALRSPETSISCELYQAKKPLLPRLDEILGSLKIQRLDWQRLSHAERARQPEVLALLRQNQDLIMKIIVMDRDNEQSLLRRGMIPASRLPAANRQRPHFVADLYRRNTSNV